MAHRGSNGGKKGSSPQVTARTPAPQRLPRLVAAGVFVYKKRKKEYSAHTQEFIVPFLDYQKVFSALRENPDTKGTSSAYNCAFALLITGPSVRNDSMWPQIFHEFFRNTAEVPGEETPCPLQVIQKLKAYHEEKHRNDAAKPPPPFALFLKSLGFAITTIMRAENARAGNYAEDAMRSGAFPNFTPTISVDGKQFLVVQMIGPIDQATVYLLPKRHVTTKR